MPKTAGGGFNSPYIFQEKISGIFKGFYTVHGYIDNFLVITIDKFADHLKSLEKVLQKLVKYLLKVNAEKSFSGQTETG